jgi:hypothetical protein
MASQKSIRADYGPLKVKRATASHAGKLQHLLRVTDLRECMIHGATPWRALHYPLTVDGASTYSIMFGKTPICMGGVVPIDVDGDTRIGSIWLLGSSVIEDHPLNFHRAIKDLLDMYQLQWDILENVVPLDHSRTIKWLDSLGFHFAINPTIVNGYAVLRFVRCASHIEVSFEEDERPASN